MAGWGSSPVSTETWLHASVTQSRAVRPGSARSPRPCCPGDGLRGLRFAARVAPWAAEGTGPRAADGRCRSAVQRAGEAAPTQLPRRPALLRQIPTSCRFGAHDAAWCCESRTPGEPAACVSVRWLPSQRSSSSPSLPRSLSFRSLLSAHVRDAETFSCARQRGAGAPAPSLGKIQALRRAPLCPAHFGDAFPVSALRGGRPGLTSPGSGSASSRRCDSGRSRGQGRHHLACPACPPGHGDHSPATPSLARSPEQRGLRP